MNKIGIQSGYLYDDTDFEHGMKMAKDAGFDCIDFNIDTKISIKKIRDGDEDLFFTKSDDELKEYYRPQKEAFEKIGLTMSQMHAPFPIYDAKNERASEILIAATEKCIMLCDYFDCPYLVVHPPRGNDDKSEKDVVMYLYRRLIPTAKKYNVGICLENMFGCKDGHVFEAVCSDITKTCEFIDELNEFAGERIFSFCYDLGHATLLGKDIKRSIVQLGDRLTVLHIHDNNGLTDIHMQPFSQTRSNGWVTDWQGFIDGLREIGFKGVLSFETFNALVSLPKQLHPVMVNYIAGVGKYLAQTISE